MTYCGSEIRLIKIVYQMSTPQTVWWGRKKTKKTKPRASYENLLAVYSLYRH